MVSRQLSDLDQLEYDRLRRISPAAFCGIWCMIAAALAVFWGSMIGVILWLVL